MSLAATSHAPTLALKSTAAKPASSSAMLRLLLVAGCCASAGVAAWVGDPAAYLRADPELAFLLRGMAGIKAAIVLVAVGLLCWRFGSPVLQRTAVIYLIGAWLTAGSAMLVWQLSFIPLAALTFHAGELTLLFMAWRDGQSSARLLKERANTSTARGDAAKWFQQATKN